MSETPADAYHTENPLTDLRKAIMDGAPREVYVSAAHRCFEDERINASLVDWLRTRATGQRCYKQAGLHQLVCQDDRFDDWRQADPQNQNRFIRVVKRIRDAIPEHVHDI